jgi:hypothetical protein
MQTIGENVKSSLRKILADSHVSAVAIAVLLFWSLDSAFWALWGPVSRAVGLLSMAVAILGIPYFSRTLTIADRFTLFITFSSLFNSLFFLAAAGLLSRWVYGMGPLRSLSKYRTKLARSNHV